MNQELKTDLLSDMSDSAIMKKWYISTGGDLRKLYLVAVR